MPPWPSGPAQVSLSSRVVDVWRVSLVHPVEQLAVARTALSPDETERADRFRFHTHRNRYIFARAALRSILGRYLDAAPPSIDFAYSSFGKPYLTTANGLSFNVSHSEDLALIAVGAPNQLGVDVERVRADRELSKLARRYFSIEEADIVLALGPEELVEAFYRCWSRKEAFIKAVGDGLSHALDRFAVTVRAGEAARLVHIDGNIEEAARWSLFEINPERGFAGAVAFDRTNCEIACYDFSF
jgi:4'-phosphopantetheinyl transferase